jgi:phosphopentomutase
VTAATRAFVIVLDSVGIGALPDAARYGDEASDTLGNLARAVGGLALPNLGRLGIGNLDVVPGTPAEPPIGACARVAIKSPGKDTTTGHWEMCGVTLDKPFRTYPDGFPREVMDGFEARIGRKVLGNKPASGTEIIKEFGDEHVRTGRPIVYTSADSVFQIACHEEVVPLPTLYLWCQMAREILVGDNLVARVIARPFAGKPGSFYRTENRRDFSLPPMRPTLLDYARESAVSVTGIGKIHDIFAGRGLDRSIHTANNSEGIRAIQAAIAGGGGPAGSGQYAGTAGPGPYGRPQGLPSGSAGSSIPRHGLRRELVLANLVDFDMVYGHRNDAQGYARALAEFDASLPGMLAAMRPADMLVVTADHGCDPTTPSTDHSREYVPVMVAGKMVGAGLILGDRDSLADLGATLAEVLGIGYGGDGRSFAGEILGSDRD